MAFALRLGGTPVGAALRNVLRYQRASIFTSMVSVMSSQSHGYIFLLIHKITNGGVVLGEELDQN